MLSMILLLTTNDCQTILMQITCHESGFAVVLHCLNQGRRAIGSGEIAKRLFTTSWPVMSRVLVTRLSSLPLFADH